MRTRTLVVASLLLLATVSAAQPAPTPTREEHDYWNEQFQAGRRAYKAGKYGDAVRHLTEALETAEDFGPLDARIGNTLEWLAVSLSRLERWEEAEEHMLRIVDLPGEGIYRDAQRARAYRELAQVCRSLKRLDEAKDWQRKYMRWLAKRKDPVKIRDAFESMAWIEIERGDDRRAASLLRQLLAMHERQDASSPKFVAALRQMALIHQRAGKYVEAEQVLRRALDIQDREGRGDEWRTAELLADIARCRTVARDYDGARALLKRAGRIRADMYGEGHPSRANAEWEMARVDRAQGRLEDASKRLETAISILEKHLGVADRSPLTARGELGWLLVRMGRLREAEGLLRKLRGDGEPVFGTEGRWMVDLLHAEAGLRRQLGHVHEAVELLRRSLALREALPGDRHQTNSTLLNNLGAVLRDAGQLDEAERLMRRSHDIRRRDPNDPGFAYPLTGLARVARQRGQLDEAETLCLRALSLRLRLLTPEHPAVAFSLETLAEIHRDQGKHDAALGAARRAVELYEKSEESRANLGEAISVLGSVLHRAGRTEEAAAELAKAESTLIEELGRENTRLIETLGRYAAVLRALGREEEAAAREAHAKEIREQAAERKNRSKK